MQKINIYSLLLLSIICFVANDAYAVRSYRCNGRVQYKPCAETPRTKSEHPVSISNNQYAKVLRSEFTKLPQQEGIWRGKVSGNGTVHLRLVIRKNGIVESTRYMGNVDLLDRATTFAFRSVTPPGKDWSWSIVAYNG